MANNWKSISSVPAGLTPDTMLLLTDGTVLVHNKFGPNSGPVTAGWEWYRLTPDNNGNYDTGTWSGA